MLLTKTLARPYTAQKQSVKRKKLNGGANYRLVLLNDSKNIKHYVVNVIVKVVPDITDKESWNIMNEAHVQGRSVVKVCEQQLAEEYCQGLRNNGLISIIEPYI